MSLLHQINVLKAAAGNPALLALATVDLAYRELAEPQRVALKEALEAASVPHWIDETVLAALVGASADDSKLLLARLRALRVVEPFPARGQGAVNVHQASRNVLRKRLREQKHDRFLELSARARDAVRPMRGMAHRIEALYHHFAIDQEGAATEWELIERELGQPQETSAVRAAMVELRTEGWLAGAGKAAAILAEGLVKMDRGESTELERPARDAIELARENDRQVLLGFGQCMLGEALSEKGKLRESSEAFHAYLEIFERQSQSDPEWRHEVAVAHTKIAGIQEEEGKLDQAFQSMQTSLTIITDLVRADPERWTLQRELAANHSRVATVLRGQDKVDAALENYRKALEIYAKLTGIDPTDLDWQQGLAGACLNVGGMLLQRGKIDEALTSYRKALDLQTKAAQLDASNVTLQRDIANTNASIAIAFSRQGKLEDALVAHIKSHQIFERLVEDDPQNINFKGGRAQMLWNVSVILEDLGRRDEALSGYRKVEAELAQLVEEAPRTARFKKDLAEIRGWIAKFQPA